MALKTYRPITPSNRYKLLPDFEESHDLDAGEEPLPSPQEVGWSQQSMGRITCRHRGGGHKRKYRLIDFKRSPP
jgi:large subunit ribosomal protein L2